MNVPKPVISALLVLAGAGVAYYLVKRGVSGLAAGLDPTNANNIVNSTVNGGLQAVGALDQDQTIGTWLYDWLHGGPPTFTP